MAKAGDTYTIRLSKTHIEWGTYRFTGSREQIYGEGYIPIPVHIARELDLLNKNGTENQDIFGKNIFECCSADGFYNGVLRAQGCKAAGDKFAKQFAGDGNLKAIGNWYAYIGARPGDRIKVTWVSPVKIEIEKL